MDALADVIAVRAARIDSALHQLLTHVRCFDEIRGWSWQNRRIGERAWLSGAIGCELLGFAKERGAFRSIDSRRPLGRNGHQIVGVELHTMALATLGSLR